MEKKFLLKYEPASLRKYPNRWTISFQQLDPSQGRVVSITKTFNINRIKDKRLRLRRANEIIDHLNEDLLPIGWPFVQPNADFENIESKTSLVDALEFAYQIRIRGKSDTSIRAYKYMYKNITDFLLREEIDMPIANFKKKEAQLYIDDLQLRREIGARSFNNNLTFVKGLFGILESREYIFKNPFDGFAREEVPESHYKTFTPEQIKIIAPRIFEENIWLFRCMLLLFNCYIRKVELTRLTFGMFDLKKGIIRMPVGVVRKNKIVNVRTIPTSIMKYFLMDDFVKQPKNFLVFGKQLNPSPIGKPCNLKYPTTKHKEILQQMKKEGLLKDIEGLHFYSWKFTGITEKLEDTDVQHVSRQAGHSDMNITLGYRRAKEVNEHFRNANVDPLL